MDLHGKAILDLGCGEGRYFRTLKEKGAVVTGIDPVPQFVKHARSMDPESRYVEGVAEPLLLEDGSFDIALGYRSFVETKGSWKQRGQDSLIGLNLVIPSSSHLDYAGLITS